jgi:hypothetical protein
MATIASTKADAGNDFLVSIIAALVTMLLLKAGMIAIFSGMGALVL